MNRLSIRMLKIRLIYGFFMVLAAWNGWGQTPYFRSKPAKELGSAQMKVLFQDHLGWMWLGGNGGLYRYDGLEFQAVQLPDSLADDPVTALFETGGRLWIGFRSGAIGYLPVGTSFLNPAIDPEKKQRPASVVLPWTPEEGVPGAAITAFCADTSGGLWMATYGEGLYCWKNGRLFQFGTDDGVSGAEIYALACDGQGRIWAATDAGISICSMPAPGLKRIDRLGKSDGLPDEIVSSLLPDRSGNIWIGMYDKGLCRYDIGTRTLGFFTPDWPFGQVTGLAFFGSTEIWAATTQNGLARLTIDMSTQTVSGMYALPETHTLRHEKVQALFKDREGLLWVLNHKGELFSANTRIALLDMPENDVQAVWVDQHTFRVWLGTPKGLFLMENGQYRTVLPGVQNVLSLWQAPDGRLWVGTFGNGVFELDANGNVIRHFSEGDGLTNGSVLSITGDAHRVWLATLGGVTEMSLQDFSIKTYIQELGTGYVYKVLADSKGRVWFGTDGNGLVVLEHGVFRHFNQAAGQALKTIYCITEDPRGYIWFSTDKTGLFRFDGSTFRHYTLNDHLHSLSINGLAVDGNGYVIIAYEDGVDILTPETGHFAFIDAASGAPAAEANLNSLCRDKDGHVWIGARRGVLRLAAFDEAFVYDPEPNITSVSVFLQAVDFLTTTVFPHDQNYFLFNFTGLWYTNPELVRYRYRLEGSDHGWVVSKEHFASYPNLAPGRYTFYLQASEHGEFEGTPVATYSFTIRPPYWTQWWFIALCLAAGGGVLYFFVHAREARFHREAALRRESVESQFAALKSQINPHFLFNSFNTLITIIEESPAMAVAYVEHLSDFYRSIMVYREKDLISLGEEMELVRNFNFLLKKRYEENFRLNEGVNGQPGYIMPLTLQMLVENAVKHNIISRSKPLVVDIFVEPGGYVVVRNNKQRKIKPEPSTHFGLQSLVNRYALLGMRPVIVEETEAFFTVKVPIIPRNED